jgi:chemotaxis protein methyltransferase CheR
MIIYDQGLGSDACLKKLAMMIYEYCGMNYIDNLPALSSKLAGRLAELKMSYWEYGEYVKRSPDEWETLIILITINETYFFREDSQLKELTEVILPRLAVRKSKIRIWSAACSTGDEPYSIAMAIHASKAIPLDSVSILATDINRRVLQIGRRGWYPKHSLSFRRTSSDIIEQYFSLEDGGYRIQPFIRERVEFRSLNLLNGEDIASVGEIDIIFCRNVLIYFDAQTTERVIGAFERQLAPGGYLLLGHADSLIGMKHSLETIHTGQTFYYRKGGTASETLRYIDC